MSISPSELAIARATTDINPTQQQKDNDSYNKGEVKVHGFVVAIENPKGSKRSGIDPNGDTWETILTHDYGEIKRTEGADGDPLDVFIGDNLESEVVYIVDQFVNGEFDEHKIMIGFNSEESARNGYNSNYDKDWDGLKYITPASISDFKKWLLDGKTNQTYFDFKTEQDAYVPATADLILELCNNLQ